MMKLLLLYAIFLILLKCSHQTEDLQEISMINELQECETENIHYRIFKVHFIEKDSITGEIILPILSKKINSKENNDLLWPAEIRKRILVRVRGRYSNKMKRRDYYGCDGVHEFRIDTILSFTDVTKEMDFIISDKTHCGSDSIVDPEKIVIRIDTLSNAERDFWNAISDGDCRFAGIMGFTLEVPNVPEYKEKYSKRNGVKIIEGTGDNFSKPEELRFLKYAEEYASKYNDLLLKYMSEVE
jgi:hypothetical protein